MNLRTRYTLLVLVLLFALGGFSARLCAQGISAQIDAYISQYAEQKAFTGSALVATDGKVVFKKGYGFADIEWNIPNATDTKFRLGSITKQFTAMLIMQLVEEGKLSLESENHFPHKNTCTGKEFINK